MEKLMPTDYSIDCGALEVEYEICGSLRRREPKVKSDKSGCVGFALGDIWSRSRAMERRGMTGVKEFLRAVSVGVRAIDCAYGCYVSRRSVAEVGPTHGLKRLYGTDNKE